MLKLLIITSPNPLGTGGQVRNYYVLRELIRGNLIEDSTLIVDNTPNNIIHELEGLGYRVVTVRGFSKIMENEQYLANLLLSKSKMLKRGVYDLVISQSEHSKYVQVAYVIHKLLKIPWTVIIQSYLWLDPFRYRLSVSTMIRTLVSINLLNKTLVHVVSDAIPQTLSSRGINLKSYSLLDIPVGLEYELIDQALKEIPEKEYDLAYMARIAWGKGVLDLIRVVYLLKRVGIDAKVMVIGEFSDEVLKERFLKYAKELDVLRNFVFTGFVSGVKKYKMLSRAKVFVYPSRVDVFPISLLEALAVGLPAVIFNSSYAHLFGDYVITAQSSEEMTKAIHALLLNEGLREELGRRARTFSRKFTHEAAARCEYKAYLKTLEWFVRYVKA
ncbi:MAG: glycosyltransferase family 4 protein [Thermosphaera sp.]